ncbi:hypothetical protein L2E82_30882 [Cichorium intybus]|uniref:Uncharacterized protein n=1 Tax=Cichorium intybus TaxID=13427 RepID=A0ACB9D1G5_CICIN|nr:hypothetical protein L2E82_30882 [Cichorium intybus]
MVIQPGATEQLKQADLPKSINRSYPKVTIFQSRSTRSYPKHHFNVHPPLTEAASTCSKLRGFQYLAYENLMVITTILKSTHKEKHRW